MDGEYERLVPDYDAYRQRPLPGVQDTAEGAECPR